MTVTQTAVWLAGPANSTLVCLVRQGDWAVNLTLDLVGRPRAAGVAGTPSLLPVLLIVAILLTSCLLALLTILLSRPKPAPPPPPPRTFCRAGPATLAAISDVTAPLYLSGAGARQPPCPPSPPCSCSASPSSSSLSLFSREELPLWGNPFLPGQQSSRYSTVFENRT